jgi:hypothetical protein
MDIKCINVYKCTATVCFAKKNTTAGLIIISLEFLMHCIELIKLALLLRNHTVAKKNSSHILASHDI